MKNPSVIARNKLQAAKSWIFRWKGLDGPPLRGFLALLVTAGAFSLFAATVRVRVSAPQQWIERKASIIHLPSVGDGAMWALRAKEGGPFPSRFEPREWEELSGLGNAAALVLRGAGIPYQPALRELPADEGPVRLDLAAKDERVFPKRAPRPSPPPPEGEAKLSPVLFPLSGIPMESMPAVLPPFAAPVDAAMAAGAWRFLIRLRPDGGVAECVPMIDQAGGQALADWLRRIDFGAETAKKSPWIGIGVGFANLTADGPDAR